jgi:hypothetical protein
MYFFLLLFPCFFCGGKNISEKQTEKITRREKGESQTEEKNKWNFFLKLRLSGIVGKLERATPQVWLL